LSVKEVLEERTRKKRKLEEAEEQDDDEQDDAMGDVEREKPGQGLKKRKLDDDSEPEPIAESLSNNQERRLLKRQKKAEKKAEKRKTKKAAKVGTTAPGERGAVGETAHSEGGDEPQADSTPVPPTAQQAQAAVEPEQNRSPTEDNDRTDDASNPADADDSHGGVPAGGFCLLDPDQDAPGSSPGPSTPDSAPQSPTFDAPPTKPESMEAASTTTSIASAVPPSEKPKHIKVPADTTALRARLAARIAALRAARKADVDGKPVRTRAELIEQRRQKETERRAHKKELRRRAKQEEELKREEALASARNSPGSIMSPMVDLGGEGAANHFAFGRLAFSDGTQMSHDLSYVKDPRKKRGPAAHDHHAQLAKLEKDKERIAGMDETKRKDVLEKEMWLAARRRAEGDKIHDDEALLKKAVKRKEKGKQKSEREWKERTKGVETAMRERQKKREDNLRKRREEKAAGRGKKKKTTGPPKVKKGRPGFEGRFGSRGKK